MNQKHWARPQVCRGGTLTAWTPPGEVTEGALARGGFFAATSPSAESLSNCRWKAWAAPDTEQRVFCCLLPWELSSPPTLGWLQRSGDGLDGSCHGIKAFLTPFCLAFSLLTNSFLWDFISFRQFSRNFWSFLDGRQPWSHWSSSLGWPLAGVHLRWF